MEKCNGMQWNFDDEKNKSVISEIHKKYPKTKGFGNRARYNIGVKDNVFYFLKFFNGQGTIRPIQGIKRYDEKLKEFEMTWWFYKSLEEKLEKCRNENIVAPKYQVYDNRIMEYSELIYNIVDIRKFSLTDKNLYKLLMIFTKIFVDLHKQKIIYNDFSSDHFLFSFRDSELMPYLIDFSESFFANVIPADITNHHEYQSPEMFYYKKNKSENITQKTDVFSLGIIFYEILTGKSLAINGVPPYSMLLVGRSIDLGEIKDEKLKSILSKMLNKEQNERPSMQKVYDDLNREYIKIKG